MRRLGLVVTKNLRVEMKYLHSIEITLGKFMTYTYFDTDISLYSIEGDLDGIMVKYEYLSNHDI